MDDYEEVRELTVCLLEQAGYEVISASTGESAIEAARAAPIDALVVDMKLPDTNGDVIARQLRLTSPRLPVLVITGYVGEASSGPPPWGVLQKPFMGPELEARVAAMLAANP